MQMSGINVTDVLPHALEKVLAFKDIREKEIGEVEENYAEPKRRGNDVTVSSLSTEASIVSVDTEEDEKATRKRQDKNRKKREKKKRAKARKQSDDNKVNGYNSVGDSDIDSSTDRDDVEIEYVQEMPDELMDPSFRQFRKIFDHFKISEVDKSQISGTVGNESSASALDSAASRQVQNLSDLPLKARAALLVEESSKEFEENFGTEGEKKMSKKKLKKLTRLSVSELKQLVARPDVVEMHDVCARDPRLLIHLKSFRNSVPVPRHWCAKRKYLQGKRGLEKPPFALPAYIQDTGIMEMRQAVQDKDADKSLKTKMRERIRPKVGKVDINYDKLHDAFFKHMTKPKLSIHGDLYYEGKEFEVKLKEKKPGILSDELRTALGMPIGANSDKFPPPWLIAMQRYGPPPSYPNLRIPGLNAPIPDGCSFGYHAGGWGKPPVDETGKPLYGNVFGHTTDLDESLPDEAVLGDTQHWGELESDEESESEESSDEEEERRPDMSGLNTPAEGLITPSGTSSVGAGLETPESIELRKRTLDETNSSVDITGGQTPQLYHILPEMEASVGDAFLGSTKIYKTSAHSSTPAPGNVSRVAGDTSSVIASSGMESTFSGQQSTTGWSSTMTSGKESTGGQASTTSQQQQEKRAKKRTQEESQEGTTAKLSKKYKDFKF